MDPIADILEQAEMAGWDDEEIARRIQDALNQAEDQPPLEPYSLTEDELADLEYARKIQEEEYSLSSSEPSNPMNPLASYSPGISFPLSKPKKSLNIDAFRAPIEDPSENAEKMKEALELAKKLKSKYKNKKKKKTEEDEPKEKEMDGENVEERREDGPVEAEKNLDEKNEESEKDETGCIQCIVCKKSFSEYVRLPSCPSDHPYCVKCSRMVLGWTSGSLRCLWCNSISSVPPDADTNTFVTHIRCRRSKVKPISVPELAELAFSADASSPLLCEKHNLPLSLYDMKNASLVCEKCIERGNFSSEVVPVAEAVAPARERIVSQLHLLISEEKKMLNAIEEHQDFTDRLENERQTAISTMEKEFAELEALITERKKAYLDSIESSIRRKGGSEKDLVDKSKKRLEEIKKLQVDVDVALNLADNENLGFYFLRACEDVEDPLKEASRSSFAQPSVPPPNRQKRNRNQSVLAPSIRPVIDSLRYIIPAESAQSSIYGPQYLDYEYGGSWGGSSDAYSYDSYEDY